MPVKDYYDATKWNLGQEDRDLFERERKALTYIKEHKAAKKILDVGCGDGLFMDRIRDALNGRKKIEIWGVDYSKYKLKKAEKKGHSVKWCDLEKGLPFEDGTFDVIYAAELIEHLYNPDYFLEECYRVLKKNGVIIVSTPNLQAWYNRVLFMFGIQPIFYEVSTKSPAVGSGVLKKIKKGEAPVGHVHVFNRAGLVDMLRQEGFEITKFLGAQFHALPKAVHFIDKAFNSRPSLASNLIAIAKKVDKPKIKETA
jgi:2-polyprenyl-3-methyl-5-hydroxy-6-metoxy-1,4-benzoquinol methylase